MPHSNNSYRWVQSSKPTSPPGDGPLPSGPLQQKRNPWAEKRQRMNRRPRTRQMKNQCKRRLSSHSSLSSHISAQPSSPAQRTPLQRRESNRRQSVAPAELQPEQMGSTCPPVAK